MSANISPALFRCSAPALAAGSPGGQGGQMVHPVHQGQALLVKAVLKKKLMEQLLLFCLYQVTNLLVDEEGLVVSVLVEEEDH